MVVWLGLVFMLLVWIVVGTMVLTWWRYRPAPVHGRLLKAGAGAIAVGYAHALAYGVALVRPRSVCGRRTLDDDFPLTHVDVGLFPPQVACHWTDSSAYGPTHPTAAGGWLIWLGAVLVTAGAAARAVARPSRTPRWARAGAVLAPAAAGAIWIARVGHFMELSGPDLHNACFTWQVRHLHTAPGGDIVRVDRGAFPPAVDCVFTDGTASLVLPEVTGLWCALAVFLVSCAALARGVVSAGSAAR
ncbi:MULTISPECIES: hypothetical protein [unclassified Streptomyces]|uniref:hypothetical protein n=1 Tax=unclassified Streptomyces TaxID=2593676 RepID=UPI0033B09278